MNPDPIEHLSQGVVREKDGSGVWRAWASKCDSLSLVTWPNGRRTESPMDANDRGFFTGRAPQVETGLRYAYRLPDGSERPDPASRWQPDGVNKPSAVFLPEDFAWRDHRWAGVAAEDLVIYELHTGTFTAKGTFDAVIERFDQLIDLGVTAIELMPVGQFSGYRNWGYDGVHPFAAQHSYGGPQGLQRLVDAAHEAGLAVLLDVIYNHIGPEGNYLGEFGHYFTAHYPTPWGAAINFDGPHSDAVRQFVIDNACMWVRDFHVDGLRLDAVHAIYDFGARHVLAELQEAVQREAARQGRIVHVIAETNQNDTRLIDPVRRGGFALDGLWNDDFHHSVHALITGERDGYYSEFGSPQQLVKTFNDVFVFDGCYSPGRQRRHGSPVGDRDRKQFVVCIQNHDQVGNRPVGDRLSTTVSAEAQRLACALLLLSPCVPLLFMGEEYGETNPFPFFCSFQDDELVEAVRRGRREEFQALAFKWDQDVPDPQSEATFASAKLAWSWPSGSPQQRLRRLYRDLLQARRQWPALRDRQHTRACLAEAPASEAQQGSAPVMIIERGLGGGIVACANLSDQPCPLPALNGLDRELILTTEAQRYGGTREDEAWSIGQLQPFELAVFGPNVWRL